MLPGQCSMCRLQNEIACMRYPSWITSNSAWWLASLCCYLKYPQYIRYWMDHFVLFLYHVCSIVRAAFGTREWCITMYPFLDGPMFCSFLFQHLFVTTTGSRIPRNFRKQLEAFVCSVAAWFQATSKIWAAVAVLLGCLTTFVSMAKERKKKKNTFSPRSVVPVLPSLAPESSIIPVYTHDEEVFIP